MKYLKSYESLNNNSIIDEVEKILSPLSTYSRMTKITLKFKKVKND